MGITLRLEGAVLEGLLLSSAKDVLLPLTPGPSFSSWQCLSALSAYPFSFWAESHPSSPTAPLPGIIITIVNSFRWFCFCTPRTNFSLEVQQSFLLWSPWSIPSSSNSSFFFFLSPTLPWGFTDVCLSTVFSFSPFGYLSFQWAAHLLVRHAFLHLSILSLIWSPYTCFPENNNSPHIFSHSSFNHFCLCFTWFCCKLITIAPLSLSCW